ncbi:MULTISPECIES: DMT family transporter [unclassified Acinetobacter]|jgi:small multidrug resistance pump|uniref:DMT family transporter n=1 Tax=unclassified Acinetobacter TaxID=196816 RepID=UPI000A356A75|nr:MULTISPECIES: SMR family transporter [unclassified Acinetobacter]MDD2946142.1 SMR family transporter [Acinetobacter sp.]OTG74667.1 QacE family quaternary ammonium compound efflux SMR transporter [Acinetobacter sp. ANC 4218]
MAFLYLSIAIIAEVIATSALKASNGFSVLWPSLATILGYAVALFFLSLTMKTIPMGIAYAIWSGAGIILISTVGLLVFKQQLDLPALIGLALMIMGIIFINVFSKSTEL